MKTNAGLIERARQYSDIRDVAEVPLTKGSFQDKLGPKRGGGSCQRNSNSFSQWQDLKANRAVALTERRMS